MNKTPKLSLLLSIMAISLVTSSTKCMSNLSWMASHLSIPPRRHVEHPDIRKEKSDIEKDALEFARKFIDQMPDDFSRLSRRSLQIVPKANSLIPMAEGVHYAKAIANKLAEKFGKEIFTIDVQELRLSAREDSFTELSSYGHDLYYAHTVIGHLKYYEPPADILPETSVRKNCVILHKIFQLINSHQEEIIILENIDFEFYRQHRAT